MKFMRSHLNFAVGYPALILEFESRRYVFIADLHIGIEADFRAKGIYIPQKAVNLLMFDLKKLISDLNPDILVIVGDLKHEIGFQKRTFYEVMSLMRGLLEKGLSIIVIKGNHDGVIERFLSPLGIQVVKSLVLKLEGGKSIGVFHGHTWPDIPLLSCDLLIFAHIHPLYMLTPGGGRSFVERCWLRGKFVKSSLEAEYRRRFVARKTKEGICDPDLLIDTIHLRQFIVLPAFNRLCGGFIVNKLFIEEKESKRLLCPIFDKKFLRLDTIEIYLLDGTYIGRVFENGVNT